VLSEQFRLNTLTYPTDASTLPSEKHLQLKPQKQQNSSPSYEMLQYNICLNSCFEGFSTLVIPNRDLYFEQVN
jgi:hypothetical protein